MKHGARGRRKVAERKEKEEMKAEREPRTLP
jgi:hypothetical protein